MSSISDLVEKGHKLALSSSGKDRATGRELLEDASVLGRSDALLFLGKSFEMEGNYKAAESAYLRGFERRYRAAVFRLALLHGKGLASDSDRNFYLRTIKLLSKDGHFPSIALVENERIRGSYGFWERIVGILLFLPNIFMYLWKSMLDSTSHDFEQ